MAALSKTSNESRVYTFDFTNVTEIAGGDTLTGTPTVSANPTGLTIGTPAVAGAAKKVTVRLSGGTSGVNYVVSCIVATTAGNTLEGEGTLIVEDA